MFVAHMVECRLKFEQHNAFKSRSIFTQFLAMGRGFWYKTQLFLAGVADRRARNELNTASALAPERI